MATNYSYDWNKIPIEISNYYQGNLNFYDIDGEHNPKEYMDVMIKLDSAYKWGEGWTEPGQREKFRKTMYDIFRNMGWFIKESDISGGCPTAYKIGTGANLYLHPMELTGLIPKTELANVLKTLKENESSVYKIRSVMLRREFFDLSEKAYVKYLVESGNEIKKAICEAWEGSKRASFADVIRDAVQMIAIPRVGDPDDCSTSVAPYEGLTYGYIQAQALLMIDQGEIKLADDKDADFAYNNSFLARIESVNPVFLDRGL